MTKISDHSQFPTLFIDPLRSKLAQLQALQTQPQPFTPGEPLFWDDPYISTQMLSAHLNPVNDLASRRPETIERSVGWLIEHLNLLPGTRVLIWAADLACMLLA